MNEGRGGWWFSLVVALAVGGNGLFVTTQAAAQTLARFTVLPQQLRIAEEDSNGGEYRVSLSRGPTEDVTVRVGGVVGTDLTVTPSSLTFTPQDWEETRTVTVVAGPDDDGTLDQVQLRHSATGGGFENVFVPGLLVVVADNDTRGLDLNPGALTVREEDADGAAYTVALKTEPKRAVTVTVDGAAGTDLVLGQTALTFDSTNWNVRQTVTVSARGDADALDEEVKLVHRANGSYLFGATVEVLVTVLDDDEPSTAVELRVDTASVEEGGGARTIAVTAAFDGAAMVRDVGLRIDVGSGTADRLLDFRSVESFVLTIPAGEDSASGTFTLRPVDDDVDENDETVTVGGVIFSPSGGLGLSVQATSVTITDDDARGVTIGTPALTVEQGENASYTVVLTSRPTASVTVEVMGVPDNGLLVPARTLVFGPPFWASPKTVRLHASNDGTPVPDEPVVLTHRVSGGDYEGVTAESVAVTIVERMLPTVTVVDAQGSEGDDALEFEVSLDSASTRRVTVDYGTFSPLTDIGLNDAVHLSDYRGKSGQVSFDPGVTRRRVRVELIDDDLSEARETFKFHLTNPQNARFPGDGRSVEVRGIIVDDDPVPTVTLALSDSSIGEDGGTATVTAALDHVSSVDTTVLVSVTPPEGLDVVLSADRTLTIPARNSGSRGNVTITAVDNLVDTPNGTVTVEGVAENAVGVTGPSAVALTIEDDDAAALSISTPSLVVMEGKSERYTVKPMKPPTGTVTVRVTGAQGTDLSVDRERLSFTPENWRAAQAVVVTAVKDKDTVDDHVTLVHAAQGGGYDNMDTRKVEVTVKDDDEQELPPGPYPTVTLALSSLNIGESGGAAAVTATLDRESDADTTVVVSATPMSPAAASDFALSSNTTLTIPAGRTQSTGTVTITGVDDFVDTADKFITVEGVATNSAGVQGPYPLLLIIEDDDTTALRVAPESLEIVEGMRAHYTVELTSQPTGTVTVSVQAGRHTDVSVDKPSLRFTPETWSTAQTVTVTAAADADTFDDHDILVHSAAGAGYNTDLAHVDVTVLERNAPSAGIVLSRNRLSLTEGRSGEYGLALRSDPGGEVTVTVEVRGGAGLTLEPTRVHFRPANWEEFQTVTVTARRDGNTADGTATLFHAASGAGYGPATAELPVTVADVDRCVVTVSDAAVAEAAGKLDFTVRVTPPCHETVRVSYRTEDGTATAPADYASASGVLTLAAGQGRGKVAVTLKTDGIDEEDEKFQLMLSAPRNAVLGDARAVGIIEDDDTAGVVVSPTVLSVTENNAAGTAYTVELTSEPIRNVTVSVTGTADTDVRVDPASLTFTAENSSTAQTVLVTAAKDDDTADDRATLEHRAAGGGYDAVEIPSVDVTVTDVDDCVLAVADAVGDESAGSLGFLVTVTPPCHEPVTVNYRTEDGTAVAPADYGSANGVLEFAAGESRRGVVIELRKDGIDEDDERLYLSLGDPRNAIFGDARAVGTITNDDPLPKAWLARYGRTVAAHVMAGVEERVTRARETGAGVKLGGWNVARPRDGAAPHRTPAAGSIRHTWGPARDRETAGRDATMTLGQFLDRSAFAVKSGKMDGGIASVWGRGSFSRFDGADGALSLDGAVATGTLGGDYVSGRWLAGMALSHSEGDGTYRTGSVAGKMSTSLSGIYPYFGYGLGEGLSVWGVAGYGAGRLALSDDLGDRRKTDVEMFMGAVGVRAELLPRAGAEGFGVAAKADALFVRTTSARAVDMAAAEADAVRVRVGVDGSHRSVLANGASLTSSVRLGLRHDAGDAERGFGLDLGAGLEWSDPALGLSAGLNGRRLVAHAVDGSQDWGVSASLRYDRDRSSGRGPWVLVRQSFGSAAEGGKDRLLARPADGGDVSRGARLTAEAGYGFPLAQGRLTGAPYVGLGWSGGAREHRLGYRVSVKRVDPVEFGVRVEAAARSPEGQGRTVEHAITLACEVRW